MISNRRLVPILAGVALLAGCTTEIVTRPAPVYVQSAPPPPPPPPPPPQVAVDYTLQPPPPTPNLRVVVVRETAQPNFDTVVLRGALAPRGYFVAVHAPPPPPRVEVFPPRPSPRHVWIGGHWRYYDGRYAWVGGRWRVPPQRGAVWVTPRWEEHPEGRLFVEGYWKL